MAPGPARAHAAASGGFPGRCRQCHVDEQTPGDNDSDGWGSISRLTLAKDGTTVEKAEIITTGLHDNCASGITPWKTYLTHEEFPFLNDPDMRSGWVWEIDPATGAEKRLTGMGHFSHEQETYASDGSWYLTDDRGDARFIYRFVPDTGGSHDGESLGNVNQVWVLPRHQEGAANLILFASTPDEPTGPWFSFDNQLLYLSIQADPPRVGHVIAIQHPTNYNRPYDR